MAWDDALRVLVHASTTQEPFFCFFFFAFFWCTVYQHHDLFSALRGERLMLMENPENFFNWKTSWQAKSVAQVLMNTFGNMNLIFAVFLVTVGRFLCHLRL